MLATVLGPEATTGGVWVNTKSHWSLHTVCTKEELDASRCLTWGQRWLWWQPGKAPLLLLCSSPWGYPCPSPALWSWCQTGPHRKEIPPLAHRDKLPQIYHSSHSGWQRLSRWGGLQVKKQQQVSAFHVATWLPRGSSTYNVDVCLGKNRHAEQRGC